MRGTIRKRYEGSWSLILDLGYQIDPATGKTKRKQKWITFRGTKKQADAALNEHVRAANRGEFVEPSKSTVAEWLREWLDKAVKPPLKSPGTYKSYKRIIESYLVPNLGATRLQALKPLDIQHYYRSLPKLSASSLQVHHALLHSALRSAERNGLVTRNVAALVENKPRKGPQQDTTDHCWTAEEASAFLKAAAVASPQTAAFYTLALDTGARRGELASLQWSDLDLASGKVTVRRTLQEIGPEPVFGPTKTSTIRTLDLGAETVVLLKAHKQHQAALKMRNRQHYRDLGLVFAKEWSGLQKRTDSLGLPLQVNTIGEREFGPLAKTAGVRRIKFHGMRHTMATLMLQAEVPIHVVSRRLGHSSIEMTLNIYAHVLPSMQQDAATKLAALLHG